MIKRLVAALMLSAMFASPAWADFKDGIKAFRAGHYALAAENWQPLAEAGDPRAQTNLGLLYLRGMGVEKDGNAALSWFERAAEQGYVTAEYNLAILFAKGITVEKDQPNAATWYLQAAEHGHVRAQFEIARRYAEGNGIRYDEIEAYKWLTLSEKRAKGKLLRKISGYKTRLAEAMSSVEIEQAELLAEAGTSEES